MSFAVLLDADGFFLLFRWNAGTLWTSPRAMAFPNDSCRAEIRRASNCFPSMHVSVVAHQVSRQGQPGPVAFASQLIAISRLFTKQLHHRSPRRGGWLGGLQGIHGWAAVDRCEVVLGPGH